MAEAVDVAPKLLEQVRKTFAKGMSSNKILINGTGKINLGNGSFETASRCAEEIGKELSKAFEKVFTKEALPNGRLYYNIADRVVRPMLETACTESQELAGKVITQLNAKAKIGLKASFPGINQSRIKGVIDGASSQELLEDALAYLKTPVVNMMQHSVDDMSRHNADFQYKSGLAPKLVRHPDNDEKLCDWCEDLAGTYDYPVRDRDIYRRHENCRCVVEFVPVRGGKKQDIYSKRWKDEDAV